VELLPALAVARLAHGALDDVALAQPVLAHLGQRDVHVVGAGEVARGAHERVVLQHVEDARDRDQHVVFGDHRLRLAALAVAGAAVPVAEPVAASPAALAVLVVVAGVAARGVLAVLRVLVAASAALAGRVTAVPALAGVAALLPVAAVVA